MKIFYNQDGFKYNILSSNFDYCNDLLEMTQATSTFIPKKCKHLKGEIKLKRFLFFKRKYFLCDNCRKIIYLSKWIMK